MSSHYLAFAFTAFSQNRSTIRSFLDEDRTNITQPDTIRALFAGMVRQDKPIFQLHDATDSIKVHLVEGELDAMEGLRGFDVRKGDTLTVVGYHNPKKRIRKKDAEMISAVILSKKDAADHDDRPVYMFSLDEEPTFQGEPASSFSQWVNQRLVYPESSRSTGREGTVRLSFTIDTDGGLKDLSVIESSRDPALDAEAVRVVFSSPAWKPGTIKGRPVKVNYTFPVIFKLRTPKTKGNRGTAIR